MTHSSLPVREWILRTLRPIGGMILRRPALVVAAGGLLALLWGLLLDDYDAFHTFWSERAWAGIATGVGVALNLAAICAVAHWLDFRDAEKAGQTKVMAHRSYFAAWVLLVVVAGLPAVARFDQFTTVVPERVADGQTTAAEAMPLPPDLVWLGLHVARLYLPCGLLLVLLAGAASRVIRLRQRASHEKDLAPLADSLVPVVGSWAAVVLLLGYVVMCVVHGFNEDFYLALVPAPVAFMFFLGLFIAASALISRYLHNWVYVLPFALGIFLVALAGWLEPEHQLPGLGDLYTNRVKLDEYETKLKKQPTALLDEETVLNNWRTQIIKLRLPEGSDPAEQESQPIILVSVSGGASTSALYVGQALLDLESHYPGITRHIRIISGASGGMLGAAYYVSQYRRGGLVRRHPTFSEYALALRQYEGKKSSPDPAVREKAKLDFEQARTKHFAAMRELREQFVAGLEADFLSPIVQKWVHKDLPMAFTRMGTTNDRGRALEAAWNRHLKGAPVPVWPNDPLSPFQWDENHGALDVPFAELREEEKSGELPSLVFTPMIVEDGRQLLISNLDLHYMPAWASFKDAPQTAYSAVEFYRLFPNSTSQFKLGTAVRMNASFPFFSPSADLPTEPRRRVVDAGYYDNYGLVVASRWIEKHSRPTATGTPGWLTRTRTPVWVIQLWAYGYDERSGSLAYPPDSGRQWSATTPLSGLFSSWRANMAYRGEERLNVILEDLNRRAADDDGGPASRMRRDIGERHLPMNWELTSYYRTVIQRESRDFDRLAEFTRLGELTGTPPARSRNQAGAELLQSLPVPNAAQLAPKDLPPKPPEPKKE